MHAGKVISDNRLKWVSFFYILTIVGAIVNLWINNLIPNLTNPSLSIIIAKYESIQYVDTILWAASISFLFFELIAIILLVTWVNAYLRVNEITPLTLKLRNRVYLILAGILLQILTIFIIALSPYLISLILLGFILYLAGYFVFGSALIEEFQAYVPPEGLNASEKVI